MGTWHLEVFKMAIYITFPVALFHYFNQPQFFKDWVEKSLGDIHKPETADLKEFRENLKKFKEEQNLKLQQGLDKQMG